MRPFTDRLTTDRLVTVVEAATYLGITPDAVRSRLRRGTLPKETGEDGTVYVRLDVGDRRDRRDGRIDQPTDRSTDRTTVAYIEALKSENELLRRELEDRKEESRRKDHIIMNMTEAMKALAPPDQEEVAPPQEVQDAPRTDGEEPGGTDPRPAAEGTHEATERPSWWRRWFGVE